MRNPLNFGVLLVASLIILGMPNSASAEENELAARHAELSGIIQQGLSKIDYLSANAGNCSPRPGDAKSMLAVYKKQFEADNKTLDSEINKLLPSLQSKPDAFKGVASCVGGDKSPVVIDLQNKKKAIEKTRAQLKENITDKAISAANKLYRGAPESTLARWSGYDTNYKLLVEAFRADPKYPQCLPKIAAEQKLLAEPGSAKAVLNKLISKMESLDKYLESFHSPLDSQIATLKKVKCENISATDPVKASAPVGQEVKVTAAAKAPSAEQSEQAKKGAVPEKIKVSDAPESVAIKQPPLKNEPALTSTGSASVVADILKEQKQGGFNQVRTGNGDTEIPAGKDSSRLPENMPPPERRPSSLAQTPEPLSDTDKWKGPVDWAKFDAYKDSLGAFNKSVDPNLNQNYENFVSSTAVQVRTEEDTLRLQKAINATSLKVNGPYARGVNVYQDGQLGTRTKSAVYEMQKDPAYRDTFLAELRKQGLVI